MGVSPKGPSDANGGDHLNAHASSRFLRAIDSPLVPTVWRAAAVPRPGIPPRAAMIPAVIPVLLVLAGLALLGIGWILLRSLGGGARVGRILAATPLVPVARAYVESETRP